MPGLTLTSTSPALSDSPASRKRTASLSKTTSHSVKSNRTLTRTNSYVSLTDAQTDQYTLKVASTSVHRHDTHSAPYPRPPRQHKERRKSVSRSASDPLTIRIKPLAAPVPAPPKPSPVPMVGFRTSSPLAPTRSILPPRPKLPRSKHEPDLYRVAIYGRMRSSTEGQKILHMGPRLALSIYTATRDLEQIVASQRDSDGDVNMSGEGGAVLSTSWVVVPPEDWEMVDA